MITPRNRYHMYGDFKLAGKICVEVGVRNGGNAKRLVTHNPAKLYLVDIWAEQDAYKDKRNTRNDQYEQMYQTVKKDFAPHPNVVLVRKLSIDASKDFENESIDFVYLDADHSERSTYMDLRVWAPKVKVGGWIAGHDWFEEEDSWSGVKKAVTRYLKETGHELQYLTKDRFHSWAFLKKTPTPPNLLTLP